MRRLLTICMMLVWLAPPVHAQTTPVRVMVFPGGFNLPIWIAEEQGFFAQEKLAVDVQPTANSKSQMTALIRGEIDIAMTAMDNVLAYGTGGVGAESSQQADLVAVMGVDSGFQNVVATREIGSIEALRGKSVAVDAPDTGYAFALYEILERHGLQRSDYRVDSVGGSPRRLDALRAGSQQVALLPTPLDLVATASGLNVLARVDRELGAYQGVVAAVRRRWADDHSAVIDGYVRALVKALGFLREPSNRPAAVALLKTRVEGMSEDLAQESLQRMLDPVSGFSATGRIDPGAVGTVITLRRKYGRNPANLAEPGAYIRPALNR